MTPLVDTLVQVYARAAAADVDGRMIDQRLAILGKRLADLQTDREFLEAHNCVRDCKMALERIDPDLPAQDQRRACLTELYRLWRGKAERPDAAQVFDTLVKGNRIARWPDVEQKKYRTAAEMILEWKDYFLSYTRRGSAALNDQFMRLLRIHYGRKPGKDLLDSGENLVARMAHDRFEKQQLDGFFDTSGLRDGDDIPDSLKKQLEHCFALVQLIHAEAFLRPTTGINWPYSEFSFFVALPRSNEPRLRFVITDRLDVITPAGADETYKNAWIGVIERTKFSNLKDVEPNL